jgi:hypothetical protein
MNRRTVLRLFSLLLLGFQLSHARPPVQATEVMEHLEILGYDVSMNTKRIKATHDKYLNILVKKYRDGILVTSIFGGTDYGKKHPDKFLRVINELNAAAAAGRYYRDDDGDLIIEAYYPGPYCKKNFTIFLDAYNYEKENLAKHFKELKRFIK